MQESDNDFMMSKYVARGIYQQALIMHARMKRDHGVMNKLTLMRSFFSFFPVSFFFLNSVFCCFFLRLSSVSYSERLSSCECLCYSVKYITLIRQSCFVVPHNQDTKAKSVVQSNTIKRGHDGRIWTATCTIDAYYSKKHEYFQ